MNRTANRQSGGARGWLERVGSLPGRIAAYWSGKLGGWLQSAHMAKDDRALAISDREIRALRRAVAASKQAASPPPPFGPQYEQLIASIRAETERFNRNNVTRTDAYWRVFERRPELHWAFLAHMVSRNGGWNMTDLKGDLQSRLLPSERAEAIFAFLERANALIFQDAYPQLRLYEASLKRRQPLFHLLPAFGVSAFMRPVWEQFWRERNSALLTVALIVNEQHYIEGRVVKNEHFIRTVIATPAFQLQSLLQLNAVVFPYAADRSAVQSARPGTAAAPEREYRLAGLILERFEDLQERIEFGKKLYAILFAVPTVGEGARLFASRVRHSGSRADYWPHLFAAVRRHPPQSGRYTARLHGCKLAQGAEPLYSPNLASAWKDRLVAPPETYDWFRGDEAFGYLAAPKPPQSFEMTNEYCFALGKLELAVLAGKLLSD